LLSFEPELPEPELLESSPEDEPMLAASSSSESVAEITQAGAETRASIETRRPRRKWVFMPR
jgi:hypothetical protein